jgi:hypothetical protein
MSRPVADAEEERDEHDNDDDIALQEEKDDSPASGGADLEAAASVASAESMRRSHEESASDADAVAVGAISDVSSGADNSDSTSSSRMVAASPRSMLAVLKESIQKLATDYRWQLQEAPMVRRPRGYSS